MIETLALRVLEKHARIQEQDLSRLDVVAAALLNIASQLDVDVASLANAAAQDGTLLLVPPAKLGERLQVLQEVGVGDTVNCSEAFLGRLHAATGLKTS